MQHMITKTKCYYADYKQCKLTLTFRVLQKQDIGHIESKRQRLSCQPLYQMLMDFQNVYTIHLHSNLVQ